MEAKYLSRDMALVANVVGAELTRKLMIELGGLYLYIPKPGREDIVETLKNNGMDVKVTANELGLSQRSVSRVLREWRNETFFEKYQQEIEFDE